jgi:hypothetical protein
MPERHIPVALLFFNLGVDAGQILFVAAALVVAALLRVARLRLPRWATLVPPYAIGTVAICLMIQRISVF